MRNLFMLHCPWKHSLAGSEQPDSLQRSGIELLAFTCGGSSSSSCARSDARPATTISSTDPVNFNPTVWRRSNAIMAHFL